MYKRYNLIVQGNITLSTHIQHHRNKKKRGRRTYTRVCMILRLASAALVPGWDQTKWHDCSILYRFYVSKVEMAGYNKLNAQLDGDDHNSMTPSEVVVHVDFPKGLEVNHIAIIVGMHLREQNISPYKGVFWQHGDPVWSTYRASEVRLGEYSTAHPPTTQGVRDMYLKEKRKLRKREVGTTCLPLVGKWWWECLLWQGNGNCRPHFSIFILFTFYLFIHIENTLEVGRAFSLVLCSLHHKCCFYLVPKSFSCMV